MDLTPQEVLLSHEYYSRFGPTEKARDQAIAEVISTAFNGPSTRIRAHARSHLKRAFGVEVIPAENPREPDAG